MTISFRVEGIVLNRVNLGEADRLVTIYSKQIGKIRAVAKGARKIISRKRGSLEPFSRNIFFIIKGKNLDIISEVQALDSPGRLRKSLSKVGLAYYFCELVDKLTPEEQENYHVYELLNKSLGKIREGDTGRLVRNFEEQLLKDLGFGIPKELEAQQGSLKSYIESIIEKKVSSPKIIAKIVRS